MHHSDPRACCRCECCLPVLALPTVAHGPAAVIWRAATAVLACEDTLSQQVQIPRDRQPNMHHYLRPASRLRALLAGVRAANTAPFATPCDCFSTPPVRPCRRAARTKPQSTPTPLSRWALHEGSLRWGGGPPTAGVCCHRATPPGESPRALRPRGPALAGRTPLRSPARATRGQLAIATVMWPGAGGGRKLAGGAQLNGAYSRADAPPATTLCALQVVCAVDGGGRACPPADGRACHQRLSAQQVSGGVLAERRLGQRWCGGLCGSGALPVCLLRCRSLLFPLATLRFSACLPTNSNHPSLL